MQKTSKLFMGFQIAILISAVALPVQAAVNIGAPRTLTGSVVTIKSNVASVWTPTTTTIPTSTPAPTQTSTPTPTPTPSPSIQTSQPSTGGNVVSLKNIRTQPTTMPVTSTPAPASTPTTAPTTPTASGIPSVTVLTADEQLMVDTINQERAAAGVSPVKVDLRLASVGRAKANDLKVNNYFAHTSPTYGSPWAMMQQVGLTVKWAGENISGNKSVSGSMAALMLSPGHRANILDPRFTHVGVGIAYGSAYGNLYVQEFLQE